MELATLLITALFIILLLTLSATILTYNVCKKCYYNYYTIEHLKTPDLGKKYFGTKYTNFVDCTGPRLTDIIVGTTSGYISKFIEMDGKVYKIEKPNSEEYLMLQKFDLGNNKVRYFRSVRDPVTGTRSVTARCIDVNFQDPKILYGGYTNPQAGYYADPTAPTFYYIPDTQTLQIFDKPSGGGVFALPYNLTQVMS